MTSVNLFTLLVLSVVASVGAHYWHRPDGPSYQEDWGYVTVRPGAHMFWWLMYGQDTSRPLVVWLQGGPGASSTGFGNFDEIGPYDVDLNPRNTTWLATADLIFIDNPVGTGYSYVDADDLYTTDVDQITDDLMAWTRKFFGELHPEYQTRPFYILCESYGGKMNAAWAKALWQAIQSGSVAVNLSGIGLGDSWISPIDYVNTWPNYLYAFVSWLAGLKLSYVNNGSLAQLQQQAFQCQRLVTEQQWTQATQCWSAMETLLEALTDDVSFYNVLERSDTNPWSQTTNLLKRLYLHHVVAARSSDPLDALMNGQVKRHLDIPANVTWGGQSNEVFQKQQGDFMKPVVDTVDYLLTETNLKVFVFNGQLDLICDTIGTERWINRLKHYDVYGLHALRAKAWRKSNGQTGAFHKTHDRLSFYWILKAGHMVAHDAPEAVAFMLQNLFANSTVPTR